MQEYAASLNSLNSTLKQLKRDGFGSQTGSGYEVCIAAAPHAARAFEMADRVAPQEQKIRLQPYPVAAGRSF
tara:strand:- start:1939 stop:2154 length:216 start_codon:yes stop_codon:yes gene_type:complete